MSQWAIPLSVALIAAMASIAAAYIAYAKDRRDMRAQILLDLAIAEKLPPDSPARTLLNAYAHNRALVLPVENYLNHIARSELVDFLVPIGIFTVSALSQARHVPFWHYAAAFATTVMFLLLRWARYQRKVSNLIRQYLAEQNMPEAYGLMSDLLLRSYQPWRIWSLGPWAWGHISRQWNRLRGKIRRKRDTAKPLPRP